ncbi:SIS domain-containing protein [Pontibacillus yanchengensis]|uniref:SIS domain-containing protein n=2 Tax=Pontibacillus yanchengensis TaxID=462910 RepID=A0ACC7VIL9_9BACI|nr:MurR/RpiR family transcriptional regulator [Pontibacillus yanchengensis]MYL34599.1 SIS domain-containing protein [Pontibacillus yanchengensis]MYL54465.1 SIS domain-containing protein [Pontibacillus yanchengensis]
MGALIDYFAKEIQKLTHAEKHVLYYIESNIEQSKHLSLTKMASLNTVSTTTVVRMCHKLGLEGFAELKYMLRHFEYESLPQEQDTMNRYENDMHQLFSSLDTEHIDNISSKMIDANRIIIVAVGLSKTLGEYFSKRLMQVNTNSSYVYESHMIDLLPNWVNKTDFVIFVSSSGETDTLIHVADKLNHQDMQSLAITNSPESTLNSLTRFNISAHVQRVTYAGYDLSARSTLMILMDVLFERYLKQKLRKEKT